MRGCSPTIQLCASPVALRSLALFTRCVCTRDASKGCSLLTLYALRALRAYASNSSVYATRLIAGSGGATVRLCAAFCARRCASASASTTVLCCAHCVALMGCECQCQPLCLCRSLLCAASRRCAGAGACLFSLAVSISTHRHLPVLACLFYSLSLSPCAVVQLTGTG